MNFLSSALSLALLGLTMSDSADARLGGADRALKTHPGCWVDVNGEYHGCGRKLSCDPETFKCVAKPGGDVDRHGCKKSTGYSWCKTTKTCERASECPSEPAPGSDVDKHGCKASAGYAWCETTNTCERQCPSEPSCWVDVYNKYHGCDTKSYCDTNKGQCVSATCWVDTSGVEHGCHSSFAHCDEESGMCVQKHSRTLETTCWVDTSGVEHGCDSESYCDDTEGYCVPNDLDGGDADEHGCSASVGETWCATTGECLREWETECPSSCWTDVDDKQHGCDSKSYCDANKGRCVSQTCWMDTDGTEHGCNPSNSRCDEKSGFCVQK